MEWPLIFPWEYMKRKRLHYHCVHVCAVYFPLAWRHTVDLLTSSLETGFSVTFLTQSAAAAWLKLIYTEYGSVLKTHIDVMESGILSQDDVSCFYFVIRN